MFTVLDSFIEFLLGGANVAAIVAEGCQDMSALYDRIGGSYRGTRGEDRRIAALIIGALSDARSVVNVGAGTGAYEPTDRDVLAIEPSRVMIEQRPRGSAPVIQARAEKLPLRDRSFDAAVASRDVFGQRSPPKHLELLACGRG